jgi:YetA-like protein
MAARLQIAQSAGTITVAGLRVEHVKSAGQAQHSSPSSRQWSVPLDLRAGKVVTSPEPVALGLPLAKGTLVNPPNLRLLDDSKREVPIQTRVLAKWSDGSAKWLLVDFVARQLAEGRNPWFLHHCPEQKPLGLESDLHVYETEDGVAVATGVATFQLNRNVFEPIQQVLVKGRELLDSRGCTTLLVDPRRRPSPARIECVTLEEKGPVRATLLFEGRFKGNVPARFFARLSFFAGTGLVRLRFTLHNPNRARHSGGLWDLGDAGSMLFRSLVLNVPFHTNSKGKMAWIAEGRSGVRESAAGNLEIYQASSGGGNWQSRNHVNSQGRVAFPFRGYRVRTTEGESFGHRASPVVSLNGADGGIAVALPEFWQQFPKAIKVDGRTLSISLFPEQESDTHELQGGERKTHTVWLDFAGPRQNSAMPLSWVHQPTKVVAPVEWYAASGVLGPLTAGFADSPDSLDKLLEEVKDGPQSLLGRRETIDEYGWRNFGDWVADHEAEHFPGPKPIISHYNNQYDCVLGSLLQYLRTGEDRWWELGDPLARHVIDIDRYHTTKDKAAYNGGLFWFTDHYLSAETSTHRTYSRINRPTNGQDYGGGPSSSHNFTSGLALHYYLTGDPEARSAVVGLADWVVGMDDGRMNPLGLLDCGPTGLASYTGDLAYHGPGRGAGNSINALIDAWLLTEQRTYLDQAEALIKRCVHPQDDIDSLDLLNIEKRWSYTVFLVSLDRYLRLKAEREEVDAPYAYAQESLLAYAKWMLENEIPYFDQAERLEYPTEAWAGQELRKANVLRLAAAHADDPLRTALRKRGDELGARAWRDLFSFESRTSSRAMALVLVEGLLDRSLRTSACPPAPHANDVFDHGVPTKFIPQKQRVLKRLKTWRGLASGVLCALNPQRWMSVGRW